MRPSILNDNGAADRAGAAEEFFQIAVIGVKGDISDKEFRAHGWDFVGQEIGLVALRASQRLEHGWQFNKA